MTLRGQRALVMGLGRFGGGLGATRWLVGQGAKVLVTDLSPPEKLAGALAEIEPLVRSGAVELRLGEHREEDFRAVDLVVANPAVPTPWADRYLAAAKAAGVPVTTEIVLLIERLNARFGRERTIGITGTVGKSTTTALLAHVLRSAGLRVLVGGNLGGSLLEELETVDPGEKPWFVLELSSAMLHWIGTMAAWSPHIAVVTNLAPNHVDWHGSVDHYAGSKQWLVRNQREGDWCVLSSSVAHWAALTKAQVTQTQDRAWNGKMAMPGRHNRVNAFQAVAAAACVRPALALSAISGAVASFAGLAHRLELVGERDGVRFFNDSKCTTPEACLTALEALAEDRQWPDRFAHIHLIAGGYDKHVDLSGVGRLGAGLGGLYTIGATGPAIADSARSAGGHAVPCGTLARAVEAAAGRLKPGDVLLLSPACASWDQYPNFEARGDEFRRLVKERWG
jgi:UDP-N-acetylmuramoylalanine--D-glutamate ligase